METGIGATIDAAMNDRRAKIVSFARRGKRE
jgi:hypothetical protein